MSNFTEMDCYLFGQATHYDIYRKMGAHLTEQNGKKGVCFDVWAPKAKRVFVFGDCGLNENPNAEQLAEIAKKYDLVVIADEVYKCLIYDNTSFKSIVSIEGMKERTILINSLSKEF